MTIAARKIRLLMRLRRSGVTDTNVLRALELIPREEFVPENFQDQAYEDSALPIGFGQTISQPLVVGLMCQALECNDRHKILDIGTGSGYQAAILTRLCRRVYSIERHQALLQMANDRFTALRLHNITLRHGDGLAGWPEQAPFDRIIIAAAWHEAEPPPDLMAQLKETGILLMPCQMGNQHQMMMRFHKTKGGWDREELYPVRFVPLLPGLPEGKKIGT